ncbi:MAG: hypothetical protein ACHQHN_15320 [Sphingobacteriales bacterium]
MNKNNLRSFLSTVQNKKYIGVASLDIIQFAIDEALVDRDEMGNFHLAPKGLSFLNQKSDVGTLPDNSQ